MRTVKAVGVAIGVFLIWFIGMIVVDGLVLHVGQTYDPNFGSVGAWFADPAKQQEQAIRTGYEVLIGIVLALAAAIAYWFARRPSSREAVEV